MMKTRLATPAKLVDINGIPGLDTLERANGHLRVGALVRHADIVALRPHLRRGRVGGAVDLRSARAQPRHAVRVGRALRSRGRLELGAARHRRRRDRPRPQRASARSRSPSSSSTSSRTRSPTTRWSPRCTSRCRRAAPAARTRSSSARSATTRRSRSPRTSSSAADGTIARAGLALTAVNPVNTKVTAAEEMLVGQQPSDERVRRRRRARGAGIGAARRRARARPNGSATSCACSPVGPCAAAAAQAAEAEGGGSSMEITVTINGTDHTHDVEPRMLLVDFIRHARGAHRHAHRLRHDELRRVHGAGRRHADEVVHDVRGAGRRSLAHHRRRPERRGRAGRRCRPRSRRRTACSAGSARRG